MWVGELPQELWDTWRGAAGGASLGTLEVLAPAPHGAAARAEDEEEHEREKNKEEDGDGEEEETSREGQIVYTDEAGRAWTYRLELVPTAAEDLRVVLSENAGTPHFALEGVVERKVLVQPCKGRKHAKKPRKHERVRATVIEDLESLAPRDQKCGLVGAPLLLDREAAGAPQRQRRTRGDQKTVTNALLRLMTERPQWTKEDLADRLDQPVSFVEDILRTHCDKALEPVPPTEPYRKPRVVYQLKPIFLHAAADSSSSSSSSSSAAAIQGGATAAEAAYQPPAKKAC